MIIDERIFSKLSAEQKKAVEAARTPEELLAIAKETGYEMSPEQLETVAGGSWCEDHCGSYCLDFCGADVSRNDQFRRNDCSDLCLKHS